MSVEMQWFGDKVIADVGKGIEDVVAEVASKVEADAIRMCPVDTGTLKETIRVVKHTAKDGTKLAYVKAGSRIKGGSDFLKPGQDRTKAGAFYAAMVELGTAKKSGTPFLRKAVRLNKAGGQKMLADAVGKALE